MPLANEESYPTTHRSVLRGHIAKTTRDADIPLRSVESDRFPALYALAAAAGIAIAAIQLL